MSQERSQSPSQEFLLAAAEAAALRGDFAAAGRLFKSRRAAVEEPATLQRWARVLAEAGLVEELYSLLDQASTRPELAPCARNLREELEVDLACQVQAEGAATPESGDEEQDFLAFDATSREEENPPGIPEKEVELFLHWFTGRGDVYARQWYDERKGKGGYWPVREQLTPWLVAQHLQCRLTLGQYLLHPDNTVSFAVVDLDPVAAALEEALMETGEEAVILPALSRYAKQLLDTANQVGLAMFAEATGGHGIHLWLFFSPRLAAARARGLLRELLFKAGPQPPDVSLEIFPKQDRLSGKGLGNLVKLPFGLHQETMRRSYFLDGNLQPVQETLAALEKLQATSPEAISAALGRRILPFGEPARKAPSHPDLPPLPSGPSPRALADALYAIPDSAATEASERIIDGCEIIRAIVNKGYKERCLSPDEARAVAYTMGIIGRRNEIVESLFSQCGVSRKELERVRRGRQAPMGCRRLRALFGGECSCIGLRGNDAYATPALHALREPPKKNKGRFAPWGEIGEITSACEEATLAQVLRRLENIENRLASLTPEGGGAPSEAQHNERRDEESEA